VEYLSWLSGVPELVERHHAMAGKEMMQELHHTPEMRMHAFLTNVIPHMSKKNSRIFSSFLTIGGSFAKNLNLLTQKGKYNNFYTGDPALAWLRVEYVQCLEYVGPLGSK
jgi:hypothetical protein